MILLFTARLPDKKLRLWLNACKPIVAGPGRRLTGTNRLYISVGILVGSLDRNYRIFYIYRNAHTKAAT